MNAVHVAGTHSSVIILHKDWCFSCTSKIIGVRNLGLFVLTLKLPYCRNAQPFHKALVTRMSHTEAADEHFEPLCHTFASIFYLRASIGALETRDEQLLT